MGGCIMFVVADIKVDEILFGDLSDDKVGNEN